MSPRFLGLDEIIEIHRDQIERYGGRPGIRDIGLVESAVAMPDLYEMAAAYLYHIVRNHAFLDGNKRAGAMAAFTFLKLHGLTLNAPQPEFERLVLATAAGKTDKAAIAALFRKHAQA